MPSAEPAAPAGIGERWGERFGALLIEIARRSIEHGMRTGRPLPVDPGEYPAELRTPRATFVTLRTKGELRGCIGTLDAREPLATSVAENAFKAAFEDPRFAPLGRDELPGIEIHVSILAPLERVAVESESDFVSRLRPGIDGVLLREGGRQATFLPAVWESLPDPGEFVRELKRKAGFSPDHWSESLEVWRYTAENVP